VEFPFIRYISGFITDRAEVCGVQLRL